MCLVYFPHSYSRFIYSRHVSYRETTCNQKVEVGKKQNHRCKEKVAFVKKAKSRSCNNYKRKATLFSKGLKLHAMTKAEVLIIVDQPNRQRSVCGSNDILDKYNKGTLRPTEKDNRHDGNAIKSSCSTDVPRVEPLDDAPDKIDIDERLASVLGHERAIAPAAQPVSIKRLSFGPMMWNFLCNKGKLHSESNQNATVDS